jgi:hypothetical protein
MSKGTVNIPITHYNDLKSIIGKWKKSHTQAINKIAELQSNILMLEQYNGSVESLIKDIKAHNLEQQAIGAYESVWFCKFEGVRTDEQPNRHISHLLNSRVKELRNQAKALKEQE